MTSFPSPLKLLAFAPSELAEMKASVQQYQIAENFVFVSSRGEITVPAGFCSDFASVPSFTKWYVDDDDPAILFGSVIHDYLYSVQGRLPELVLDREGCDKILIEAMLACGASWLKRQVVFRAIRTFGGSHWPKNSTL